LPCMVYAMDLTVLNLALPAISAELDPTASQLLWIVDVYGFLVAGFLITMGTLGDRIGRRKLLLIGGAAFGAASIVAAFADSAAMLIAMRALLGVAGATLAPSTMSLIRNMFHDEHQRQFAIGVWIASFSLGGALGPLVGGVLLQYFWWGSVFLVAVPVMALLLLVGPRLLPEYRDPNAGTVDLASVAQSLAAVLSLIFGLKQLAEHGPSWTAAAFVLAGLAVGTLFVRRQAHLTYPLLDMSLFRRPRFAATIAAYGLTSLAMFGVYIFITQYLQLVLGLSPLKAGLATVPWALAFVVGSLLAPRLTRRVGALQVMVGGLLVAAFGYALLVFADLPSPGANLALLIVSTVVMSLGMAPVFTLGNEIIITSAPPERAGAASALSETASEFSGACGIAIFGSLGMALYRHRLGDAAGVPDAPAEALATLGGALDAASRLPAPEGQALLEAARAAFVDALQASAGLATVVVLVACVVTLRLLRPAAAPARSA
ncbi:MAG TPA: MFS transporter, partial [Burkholderiaceae bacterium]|nr:MFS transporter [Burkholderiaceae bacterium]